MRIFLIALLLTGCATAPKTDRASSPPEKTEATSTTEFWFPTRSERKRAEQIAREYATRKLRLTPAQLDKMKTRFVALRKDNSHELIVQFYDPALHHPPPKGSWEGMRGGFPGYFTVTVDVLTWKVSRHYAERA